MITEELFKQKEELDSLIRLLERKLEYAPEGKLRIAANGNHPLYFHMTDKQDTRGRYILRSEQKLANDLAQKQYNEKLHWVALDRRKNIDYFLAHYSENDLCNVYGQLNPLRRELVTPLVLTDDQYAEEWLKEPYIGLPFRTEDQIHETERHEKMRSKTEARIAKALYEAGIPYKYECPLHLPGGTYYPDFTILKKKTRKIVYWEHCGIMDSEEYRNGFFNKQAAYAKGGVVSGVNLIMTFEEKAHPLNITTIRPIIEWLSEE